jgi:hypothetical protein
MAHVRNLASAMWAVVLLASSPAASAATKVDEGFASRHERNGRFARPTNRIDQGKMGEDAYYWIQWRDHPVGRSTFRCRVTYHEGGSLIVDEEITYEDSTSEGYSLCGFSPSKERDLEGTYTFTQYLDGAKVGESDLRIETHFLDGLRLSPWKIGLALFGLGIVGFGWLGKREDNIRRAS